MNIACGTKDANDLPRQKRVHTAPVCASVPGRSVAGHGDGVTSGQHPHAVALSACEPPLEDRRRHERRGHHCHHNRREHSLIEDPLAVQRKPKSDVREDETNLSARNHADSNGNVIEPRAETTERTGLFAHYGGDDQQRGEPERTWLCERPKLHTHSHDHKEHGHEEHRDGTYELLETMLAPIEKIAIVRFLENQTALVRPHDC